MHFDKNDSATENPPANDSLETVTQEGTKRRTVVGPWKNGSEFNKVYEWLFGENYSAATRQQALSQIRIWNLRRSTQCPAAVLATAVIVEVQQKDHPETIYSAEDLQTLYANAFTRFFNFMSSIMQTHNMRTMYQTAKELGLESFVVDLRHICAHGQVLPPLQVLRNTAEYCIVWLHDYYWRSQLDSMCDVDATRIRRKDRTELDDKVSALFELYDTALEGHMKGATNMKTLKRHVHGKRFHSLKEYYQQNNFEKLQDVFDHIAKELYALVKRDVIIKDVSTIYIGALLRMRYFFSVSNIDDSAKELESLITVNQTLFRMLAIHGFLDDLFYALIDIAESPIVEANKRASASFWAVQIIKGFKAFRQCKQMYKAEMDENTAIREPSFSLNNLTEISEGTRELYIYSGVGMKKTLLFGDNFRRPWVWVFERDFLEERLEAANDYTAPILKGILPLIVPELSGTEVQTFSELIDCYFNANIEADNEKSKKSPKENNDVYTAEDLLNKLKNNEITKMDVEVIDEDVGQNCGNFKTYGLWTEVEDDDWKSSPLGRVPWEL
ncbi:uncharacterized protein LOC133334304 [Musca vetustissima]|uniref:uncharacterized protein LOC133334304 n=1 Tax=Musca vetustissima TaxID=27455 RepID=UPI002AB5E6CC|nr:uncharacterized protein LOC133334304 [Musca vetustissima]